MKSKIVWLGLLALVLSGCVHQGKVAEQAEVPQTVEEVEAAVEGKLEAEVDEEFEVMDKELEAIDQELEGY